MRGRKPGNVRMGELGKPGLTSIPMTAAGAPVGDEAAHDDPADIVETTETPELDQADDQAKRRGGGGGKGQEPPDWMTNEHARAEWRRLMPLMLQRRQYVPLFATELARYCVAFGQYVKAIQDVETNGAVAKSSKGVKMLSQEWVVASRAHEIMQKLAADMGFNPVAQMRLAGSQLDLFEASAAPTGATTPDGGNVVTGTAFGALRRSNK